MTQLALNYLSRLKLGIVFFAVLVAFNVIDIYDDLLDGSSLTHVIEESIMVLIFLSIIVVLIRRLNESIAQQRQLKKELQNITLLHQQQSAEMQKARQQYSDIIEAQFEQWGLTKSEKEVGFLLLKGLSLKEIADVRNVKEKTIRQQASNIYSKAGVTGRHEFAGWFFDER
jgi:DNA-binding NarL/FixJ family response regulator